MTVSPLFWVLEVFWILLVFWVSVIFKAWSWTVLKFIMPSFYAPSDMKSTQCAHNAKLFFLGLCQYLHQPRDYDALSVQFLKNMGGVPFCLTNVPQSMFSLQCSNPAFGATGIYYFTDVSWTSSAKLAVKKLFRYIDFSGSFFLEL